jgi:MSHA pilin protein MshC
MRRGHTGTCSHRRSQGFTVLELVLVIVMAGVLAAIVGVRWSAQDINAPYQADLLARNIRHAQFLAMSWGQRMRLTPSAGAYSVACVTAGAAPCDASPVIDPATGASFTVTLQDGVTLAGASIDIDSFGRPVDGGGAPLAADRSVTLTAGAQTYTVSVRAVTGFVSVATP